MGKATITISDQPKNEINFNVQFDPELSEDTAPGPAQLVALDALTRIKQEGLEKILAPYMSAGPQNGNTEPQTSNPNEGETNDGK
jgi:hypothetical protein